MSELIFRSRSSSSLSAPDTSCDDDADADERGLARPAGRPPAHHHSRLPRVVRPPPWYRSRTRLFLQLVLCFVGLFLGLTNRCLRILEEHDRPPSAASFPTARVVTFADARPQVDYTGLATSYPPRLPRPTPAYLSDELSTLGRLLGAWGPDALDAAPPVPRVEVLQHFEYGDPEQMAAAEKFRGAELPFKITNVPEVRSAGKKWTVNYLSRKFSKDGQGFTQMSRNNFFLHYLRGLWDTDVLGPYPSVYSRMKFDKWAEVAAAADETSLGADAAHYYFHAAGAPKAARFRQVDEPTTGTEGSFIAADLPSFSGETSTFFNFDPGRSNGIQCRFSQRGVTSAAHYDGGRNMVAMVLGAKRYILSPPNACPYLSIHNNSTHPSYRHSPLNFGRMGLLDGDGAAVLSEEEREGLRRAAQAPAIETVLKQGEVLYIPSHWFHYIISLQMSAQCNTRSGQVDRGTPTERFGGHDDITSC